jgi:hypothetical protein
MRDAGGYQSLQQPQGSVLCMPFSVGPAQARYTHGEIVKVARSCMDTNGIHL